MPPSPYGHPCSLAEENPRRDPPLRRRGSSGIHPHPRPAEGKLAVGSRLLQWRERWGPAV